MSDQFPNDVIDGKQRTIVHIWCAALDAGSCPGLTSRATDLLRNIAVGMDGFLEGRVFEADDAKSVTVVTSWETRHAWAQALWNERVDQLIQAVERGSIILDIISYQMATVVPTKT
jgi:heme-degrading monooxygenase HmoA